MSKAEILAELSKLTPEERLEVRLRLAELDQDEWLDDGQLTDKEKRLIEERYQELEERPDLSIPWNEAKARLIAP
jgi:hypothetical protein